jgi:hypothetical protein
MFQGYGTVITANYFNKIRRAVYLQKYANGVVITNNTVWLNCGGDANSAAFEVDGVDQATDGTFMTGNLIEMVNYVYGVRLTGYTRRGTYQNNFFDIGVSTLGYYYAEAGSTDNTILTGEGVGPGVLVGPGALLNNVFNTQSYFQIHNDVRLLGSLYIDNGQFLSVNGLTGNSGIAVDGPGNLVLRANGTDQISIHQTYTQLGLTYIAGVLAFNADGMANRIQMGAVTFSLLGSEANGSVVYCSDCTIANPCAGSGTGALAKKLNGVWVCN